MIVNIIHLKSGWKPLQTWFGILTWGHVYALLQSLRSWRYITVNNISGNCWQISVIFTWWHSFTHHSLDLVLWLTQNVWVLSLLSCSDYIAIVSCNVFHHKYTSMLLESSDSYFRVQQVNCKFYCLLFRHVSESRGVVGGHSTSFWIGLWLKGPNRRVCELDPELNFLTKCSLENCIL